MNTVCECGLYLLEGYGLIAGPLGKGVLHTRKRCDRVEWWE